MQFSAREDIDVPIDTVFAMLSDFDRFERLAMRRGADVRRMPHADLTGTTWETEFKLRGRLRQFTIVLEECDAPTLMRFEATSKGMRGSTVIELLALSSRRTRMDVRLALAAKTLPARLVLQSLKLGQTRFRRQFQQRFRDFAREMEDRTAHGL